MTNSAGGHVRICNHLSEMFIAHVATTKIYTTADEIIAAIPEACKG